MKRKLLLCAVLITAILATMLVGCSKEKDRFESDFKPATEEQTATAVKKLERLVAVEEAVKKNLKYEGEEVSKKNMIMEGKMSGSASEGGMSASFTSKSVEKYDFSVPGSYKLSGDYTMSINYLGQNVNTTMGMYVDTADGLFYVSVGNQKGYTSGVPMSQIESYFESNGQQLSVKEILQCITDAVCEVSVDSRGNIKVTDINDTNFPDLTYVVLFEDDNNYSVKKSFTTNVSGITCYCEITILPTDEKVNAPSDKDQYEEMSVSGIGNMIRNALGGF